MKASVMRVLQAQSSKGYAENESTINTSLSAQTNTSTSFGNNNDIFRSHQSNTFDLPTNNPTPASTTPRQQLNTRNNQPFTEKLNWETSRSGISGNDGTQVNSSQSNYESQPDTKDGINNLQNIESTNKSFFEDCVSGFARLEGYIGSSSERTFHLDDNTKGLDHIPFFQRNDNRSQYSGSSTPSFEEIQLDNFALERELNRIIQGTSIGEQCSINENCNCKVLQESLNSYEPKSSSQTVVHNAVEKDVSENPSDQLSSSSSPLPLEPPDCDDMDEDDETDDDEEEHLSSHASTCTSVSTPQRSHFPRGIVNPNYPGFQHLAHTLSEHYISHRSPDPYDSDISDYDMELCVDSCDCDSLDCDSSGICNDHNHNNNLSSVMVINNSLKDSSLTMDCTEDEFQMKTFSESKQENDTGDTKTISVSVTRTPQGLDEKNTSIDELSESMQTYLKLYDVTTEQQESIQDKNLKIQIPLDDGNYGCPTPDILIKNYSCDRYSWRLTSENRPDLLRNVSPNPPMKCRFEAVLHEDQERLLQYSPEHYTTPPDSLCTENKSDSGRDDISLGLTPVDIVGDFGQEVEREFGLIVSGYNSRLDYVNYPTGAFYLYNVEEGAATEKISDALLSNGTEQIATNRYSTIANNVENSSCQDLSGDIKPSSSNIEHNPASIDRQDGGNFKDFSQDRQSNQCSEMPSTDRRHTAHTTFTTSNCVVSYANSTPHNTESSNVTFSSAQRQYQKPSYDERQLPSVGLGVNVKYRAWFETSSSCNGRNSKKPRNTDRISKTSKLAKYSRGCNSNSSAVKHSNSSNSKSTKNKENYIVSQQSSATEDQTDKIDCEIVEPHRTRYSVASWAACLRDSNRSHPRSEETTADTAACFEVYNIETALPDIDLDAVENHLRRANEEERRRRNDREEIRRRLAMGAEDDYFTKLVSSKVRPGRKPSLQSRLQNGKNLQICFVNDASSDTESHSSDSETCPKLSRMSKRDRNELSSRDGANQPLDGLTLSTKCTNSNKSNPTEEDKECDFFTRQARLQIEARMALSQAKDIARMQMEMDRQKQRISPITGIIRGSLEKVGVYMAPEKRRVCRLMLTDMNIAQLQIIVNDLHTQIEDLNDGLVHYLMERDDLHMSQDSMLVDIEDISRFLSARELESDDH